MYEDEFNCLSVCLSRHHAHISTCIAVKFHLQHHSNNGKIFSCFPLHASFPNLSNYAETNSSDNRSGLPISPVSARAASSRLPFTVATASVNSLVLARWAHVLQVKGSNFACQPFFRFYSSFPGDARYLLLVNAVKLLGSFHFFFFFSFLFSQLA